MALKYYSSLAKGLTLKVKKFWGLKPRFAEVTGEKLVGGLFESLILDRVKCVTTFKMILSLRNEYDWMYSQLRNGRPLVIIFLKNADQDILIVESIGPGFVVFFTYILLLDCIYLIKKIFWRLNMIVISME